MATSNILCGICEARHVTKCAEHWCPECEEGLCADCHDHHSLSKATRGHRSLSIENYRKLPAFIVDITDSCKEHGLKITHFCKQHDEICCVRCTTTKHRKCGELQLLDEIIQNSKTSATMSILETRFEEMLSFITQGINDRKQNILSLSKEQQQILDIKIKQIRRKINSHLDTLEKSMITKLTEEHTKNTLDMQTRVRQLSEKYHEIEKLKDSILAVKKYGTNLQTFFGVRKTIDEVNKADMYLKSTSEDKCFHNVKLIGKIDPTVTDILSLTSLGNIDVETNTGSLAYKSLRGKEAQITTVVSQKSHNTVNDIKLKLLSTFKIPNGKRESQIWGCTVSRDEKMIFADQDNKRLVILNADNSYDKDIVIDNAFSVYDVTLVDQQTVALTNCDKIQIIDIETKHIKAEIKSTKLCYGIAHYKDSLLWCEEERGVNTAILPNKIVCSKVQKQNLPAFSYLATFDDKVYLTDYTNDSVECFTIDGKKEWQFNDSSILEDPTCVTVDNNMFVYTTSSLSNSVVVISPDGQQGRKLLSSNDGLIKPHGICFNKNKNTLLIVNENGTAFLYHID